MANIPVPSIATATAESDDTVLGSKDGAVRRFPLSSMPVGFTQSGSGAVARTVQDKIGEVVSVKDFGAVGDGVTDDTAAIQAAIDYVGSVGGGTVYLPSGAYMVSSALNVASANVSVVGSSKDAVKIIQHTASAKVFNITAQRFSARSLSIEYNTIGSAGGSAFYSDDIYGNWNDVVVKKAYNGFEFVSGSNSQFIYGIVIEDCKNTGIFINAGVNVTCSMFFIVNADATNYCTSGCIRMQDQVEGCHFTDGQTFKGFVSLATSATSYAAFARPAYNKFTDVFFDSSDQGVILDKCVEIDFISCWFSNRPNNGAYLFQTDGVRFIGGGAINCAKRGVLVSSASKNVTFIGFVARGNSASVSNSYDGIEFGGGTDKFAVIGCTLGEDSVLGFGSQRYGLSIGLGCTNYVVSGNTVTGNASAGIVDSSTTTTKHVFSNIGHRTHNSGLATITAGNTSVNVAHGLAVTPKKEDCFLTPMADTGGKRFWISSTTSSNIVINIDSASGGDIFLSWQARSSGS